MSGQGLSVPEQMPVPVPSAFSVQTEHSRSKGQAAEHNVWEGGAYWFQLDDLSCKVRKFFFQGQKNRVTLPKSSNTRSHGPYLRRSFPDL
jgi:hypothetical protein